MNGRGALVSCTGEESRIQWINPDGLLLSPPRLLFCSQAALAEMPNSDLSPFLFLVSFFCSFLSVAVGEAIS